MKHYQQSTMDPNNYKAKRLLTSCQAFDKGNHKTLDRNTFFLLAAKQKIVFPLEDMMKIVAKFSSSDRCGILYENAINYLFGQAEQIPLYSTIEATEPLKREESTLERYKRYKSMRDLKREALRCSKEAFQNVDPKDKLMPMKEFIRTLRMKRRIGTEKKDGFDESVNIINGKSVDYFDVTNYKHAKSFKKTNETIEANTKALRKTLPKNLKYSYSGLQEYKFLKFSEQIPTRTRNFNRLNMIHSMSIEYRQLDILRLRFLRNIQENAGVIPASDFKNLFHCVIKSASREFEQSFFEVIQDDDNCINYYKLCELINLYQYHLYRVKYFYKRLTTTYRKDTNVITKTKKEDLDKVPSWHDQEMDSVVDYIWCRLSEKYIKISKAFRTMDITIRGKLNFYEFKYGLENLHIRLAKEQFEKLFQLLDKDKDGFLSFQEFSLLAKGSVKEIEESTEHLKNYTTFSMRPDRIAKAKEYKVVPMKNVSVVGDLLLGKQPDYNSKYKAYGIPEDSIKIYPTEKNDWRQTKIAKRIGLTVTKRAQNGLMRVRSISNIKSKYRPGLC